MSLISRNVVMIGLLDVDKIVLPLFDALDQDNVAEGPPEHRQPTPEWIHLANPENCSYQFDQLNPGYFSHTFLDLYGYQKRRP